ncbi:SpoIIE family protein phosphatase [Streptomyces sp. NPDC001380]|uniref:ATP-binding SpoIIE family protein phosphatase n=1 Tax=Streptomyces sp. NPDC001380 TaxID=3364566 RepID=UPI0036C2321A
MDDNCREDTAQRHGAPEPEADAWDLALTEVLAELCDGLGAHAASVHLASSGGRDLVSVAIAGTPLSVFTVPERTSADGPHTAAIAYRSGLPARLASDDSSSPGPVRLLPSPCSAVSVPLTVHGRVRGALTGLWTPPRPEAELVGLQVLLALLADRLAASCAGSGPPEPEARPAGFPAILPTRGSRTPTPSSAGTGWGLTTVPASRGLSLMYQLHKLSMFLNLATATEDVVRAAFDHIATPFGADGCVVALASECGLRVVGRSGARELARTVGAERPDRGLPGLLAAYGGMPLFLPDRPAVLDAYRGEEVGSAQALAVLPLPGGRTAGGCLMLAFDSPHLLEGDEQATLLMMTQQVSTALDRARLGEAERALGDALQRKLLPRVLPEFSAVTVTARYASGPETSGMGGDWYDVIPLPDGHIGLVVGDVEGHSTDSAAVMGQLRNGLRAYAAEGHAPSDVLARSCALLSELDTDLYTTCCFVSLDGEFGTAEVVLAGHPAPLLVHPDGRVSAVEAPPNVPLAVLDGQRYLSGEATIAPGTILVLYTDGMFARTDGDPEARVRELLARDTLPDGASLYDTADRLMAGTAGGSALRSDDAVLLLARYEGSPTGAVPRIGNMLVHRHDLRSVGRVRRFVRDFLHEDGLERLADDIEIMASEITTNALVHADSDVEVWIREYADRIHLEVRDVDVRRPVITSVVEDDEVNATSEHGRGLSIVDVLSLRWGTSPSGRGKAVWIDVAK